MPLKEMLLAMTTFPAPFTEQTDGTLTLDFVAAERKSLLASKKISYHCRVSIDEGARTMLFFEILKERGAGISAGDEMGPGFSFKKETYSATGSERSGSIEESSRLTGKGYSLSFDYGAVREAVKREAETAGYQFSVMLRESAVSKGPASGQSTTGAASGSGERIRPGRWYYGLAFLILVLGGVVFGLSLAAGIQGVAGNLQRMVMPRSYFITLPEAGKYTIFHEYRSSVAGKVFATNNVDLSDMRVSLVAKATGEQVRLVPPSTSYSYSSGVSGTSMMEFDIRKPGIYQFSAWYARGAGPEVVFAIGRGFGDRVWGTVAQSLAILLAAVGLSILTALVVFFKRRKAGRGGQFPSAEEEASAIEPR
jgi:hypothetical protein